MEKMHIIYVDLNYNCILLNEGIHESKIYQVQ